jgi:ribonuclease-3
VTERRAPLSDEESAKVEARLGYRFRDRTLLEQALTHVSFSNEAGGGAIPHYDRLEFLGDAVVSLVLAEREFQASPAAGSGELSLRRARGARLSSLADAGERLGLGGLVRLSSGERTQGGSLRRRLLADLYEAVVGAIYLEGGLPAARAFIERTVADAAGGDEDAAEDHKSRLQELLQGQGEPTPVYRVVETSGPPHDPIFLVEVDAGATVAAQGVGGSKREAEQAAARAALAAIERIPKS